MVVPHFGKIAEKQAAPQESEYSDCGS